MDVSPFVYTQQKRSKTIWTKQAGKLNYNVDTVGAGDEFKTRIDVLELEETLAVC